RADQRLLYAVHDCRDVVHLSRKLLEQSGEHHETRAEWQLPLNDEPASIAEQDHHIDSREETHRGGEQAHAPENSTLLLVARLVGRVEACAVGGLTTESFRNGDPLNTLREGLHHPLHQRAVVQIRGLDYFRE